MATNQYKEPPIKIPYGVDTLKLWGDTLGVSYEELYSHIDEIRNRDSVRVNAGATPQRSILYSKKIAADMLAFLIKYTETSILTYAAVNVGVSARSVRYWRKTFPIFDEMCSEIQETIVDVAEDELYRRAIVGEERHVYHQGAVIDSFMEKSNDLLKYMLNANRTKYRQKSEVVMVGAAGGPIQVQVNDVDMDRMREKLLEKLTIKQHEMMTKDAPKK